MNSWIPNKTCRLALALLFLWPQACVGHEEATGEEREDEVQDEEEGEDEVQEPDPPRDCTEPLPLLATKIEPDRRRPSTCSTSTAWPAGEKVSDLNDPRIDESSGLAMSSFQADLFWTHNDSGDEARLYVFDTTGQVLTDVTLPVTHIDWEDLAIGPCEPGQTEIPCVYVADIGDNERARSHVTIYRFPEPDLACHPDELFIDAVDTLHFRYPEGPRDAEALLVHPFTAQIWVVEKTGAIEASIFEIPANFESSEIIDAAPVASLPTAGPFNLARTITAGDIAPDGSEFTLRSYLQLYTFCVPDGSPFEAAFQVPPRVQTPVPALIQSEALTYDRLTSHLWLTSERLPAPLIQMKAPDAPDNSP